MVTIELAEYHWAMLVDEFKKALEQEITASRANMAASAVALTDGRLIAPVGGAFHYRFETSTRVRVPSDTDGDLILPNQPDCRIPVSIVDVHDFNVTLAVSEHIGSLISAARLETDLTMLLRRLIDRIDEKGQEDHPAADRVLGSRTPSGTAVSLDLRNQRQNPPLNCEQEEAVRCALGWDTTFIWGPPGTGKTYSIGEIGAQLFVKGKSLLIASHTNTAIDGAVLRIAEALQGEFQEGDIVRVGEPIKPELRDRKSDVEIVMRRIAEKRSAVLKAKQQAAQREHEARLVEAGEVQRLVEIAEWLLEAPADLASLETEAGELAALDAKLQSISHQLTVLNPEASQKQRLQAEAAAILARRADLDRSRRELVAALTARDRYCHTLEESEARLRQEMTLLSLSRSLESLRQRQRQLPTLTEVHRMVEVANIRHQSAVHRASEADQALVVEREVLSRVQGMGTIKRLWLNLPNPGEQAAVIEKLQRVLNQAREEVSAAQRELETMQRREAEVREATNLLAPHESVPGLPTQEQVVANRSAQINEAKVAYQRALVLTQEKERAVAHLEIPETEFVRIYGLKPEEGARIAENYFKERDCLDFLHSELMSRWRHLTDSLGQKLRRWLDVLAHWGLTDGKHGTIPEMLASLTTAQQRGFAKTSHRNLEQLRLDSYRLAAELKRIEDEIDTIEQQLARIDEDLIANARILATTLTRSYMRNGIQSRKFDTVLVDEVSMAPIPALWAVATLVKRAIVVVGDFLQLPPIVQSEESEAKKWLGRDAFKVHGLADAWERGDRLPSYFVALKEQHRMHPEISAIVNRVYKGALRDSITVTRPEADRDLRVWLAQTPRWDNPVILIDTSQYGGWNTAKDRSRCNPLSAMLAAETVSQMLAKGRPPVTEGYPRILVISPYRPHAKLLQVMFKDDGVDAEVLANTVHSFQGSEADAVILDLVVDNPHWKTNITNPKADLEIIRLMNVALSRARRRLVVIGNFDWLRAKGSKAFVGKELLSWLEHHQLLPAQQSVALDRMLPMTSELGPRAWVSPAHIYPLLMSDIAKARRRVVVFSPHLTSLVVEQVKEKFRTATANNVAIFVVACPLPEYPVSQRNDGVRAEHLLGEIGIRLVHKTKMLEKMAIMDDQIIWCASSGLFDTISPENEVSSFRRESPRLTKEILDIYHLDELLDPYRSGGYLCPICNSEMLVAEAGKNSSASQYWSCANTGCYTRNIGDPPLQNGRISLVCGTDFKLGDWGGKFHWICTCGKHHRQQVHKNHLRLPRMRELIPKAKWTAVCRQVGFDPKSSHQQVLQLG